MCQVTKRSCAISWSIVGIVGGIIAIIVGIVLPNIVTNMVADGMLEAQRNPTDPSSVSYAKWVGAVSDSSTIRPIYSYYFFNITNPEDVVLRNALPNVQEVGPYNYVEICKKINVEYSSDYSKVSWIDYQYKKFELTSSIDEKTGVKLTEKDVITGPWLTYWVVLAGAGLKEDNSLAYNMFGPALAMALNGTGVATGLNSVSMAEYFGGSYNVPLVFAPTVTVPVGVYLKDTKIPGMPSFIVEFGLYATKAGVPTALDAATAMRILYTATINFGQGTMNIGLAAVFQPSVYGSAALLQLIRNGVPLALIQASYNLPSTVHVQLLAQFIMSQAPVMFETIAKSMGSTNYGDSTKNHFLASRTVDKWLYNSPQDALVKAVLGRSVRSDYFPFDCGTEVTSISATGDRIPDEAKCTAGLKAANQFTRVGTGVPDINNVDTIYAWNGFVDSLPPADSTGGYWCGRTEPVVGRRTPSYPPAKADGRELVSSIDWNNFKVQLFSGDAYRKVDLDYAGDSEVLGIPTKKYTISPTMLQVNPAYNQTVKGIGNLQCIKKAPIYISNPRFYDVDANFNNFFQVPTGIPTASKDRTVYLEIDPVLGASMRGHLMLQVNIALSGGMTGISNSTNAMGRPMLMPVLYVDKHAELNSAKAKEYKDSISYGIDIAPKLFLGGIIGGSIGAGLSILFLILAILKCEKNDDISSTTGSRPSKRGSIKLEDLR